MKSFETITKTLNDHKQELSEKYGVKNIGVFGSYGRNEQVRASDIDVLVTFSRDTDLFEFIGLKQFLEKLLGKKVDLVMKSALKPRIKRQILKEVHYA